MEAHPPLDPAEDRAPLVEGEVVAGLRAEQEGDFSIALCCFSTSEVSGLER